MIGAAAAARRWPREARPAASTSPSAASAPCPFQYVSGCASRSPALGSVWSSKSVGSSRSDRPYAAVATIVTSNAGSTQSMPLSRTMPAPNAAVYRIRRSRSANAGPPTGAHSRLSPVQAVSAARPPSARRPLRERGSGLSATNAASASSRQARIATRTRVTPK